MAKGINANTREGLRSLKPGEKVVYYGGGFHIEKMIMPVLLSGLGIFCFVLGVKSVLFLNFAGYTTGIISFIYGLFLCFMSVKCWREYK